jgi:outer membrane receptor protein involved in Fe transport
MPQFDYLYTNANINVAYGFSPLGDPDLKPARTIAYEVGYRTTFSDLYLLDVTFFNKSVTNLIDSNTFLNADPTAGGQFAYGLTRFVNSAYVSISGLEIFLKKRIRDWIGGKISYTYLNAHGTGSSELEKIDWIDDTYQVPNDQYPLSWDQRHTVVANVNLKWWESWGANLLYRWNSGLPFTRLEGYNTRPNNARMGSTSYLDLRFEKIFTLQGIKLSFFTEIYNLFNTTNVLWVDSNGQHGGRLGDISALDLGRRIQLGVILSI